MDATERTSSTGQKRGDRARPFLFLVLEGARPTAGGARLALEKIDAVILGRGDERTRTASGATVTWTLPDTRMSTTHARVARIGGAFHAVDEGSTNGTLVNGNAVAAPTPLDDGDVITLGQSVFVYREIAADTHIASIDLRDTGPHGLATLDPALAKSFDRLSRVAVAPLSLLFLGETGTGKEVLARAAHALSKRPGPFVAVNCGAIPPNLVESHLFGHVRGAFSGATRDEPGLVRSAHDGTLLLDEIGDLPPAAQASLLRVLQEGEVLAVGSSRAARVDVRVLAATHKSLEGLVERGEFRRDLYARLAGYVFEIAPLRDRLVDLGLLVASLFAKIGLAPDVRFHRDAARALVAYDWPMNVRELEQCLRASSALAEGGVITKGDLPAAVAEALDARAATDQPSPDDEALRRELLARLADAKGNVTEVARAMGKARQQVQRWARRFGIDPSQFRDR